jgi:hypothetical protein
MLGKNTIYYIKWFNQKFILITYEDKNYDKKVYWKSMLNRLKVMEGLTLIYTPLGT